MPTTDGDETTATPTTTQPAETTGTDSGMDVDCDADDYLLPFVASSPIFTADSASLVVHIEDDQGPRIVRMSLCGDVEETLVTGVDVTFPELALPPANDRLYFTAGGDMPGLSSISYPGGGPVTLPRRGRLHRQPRRRAEPGVAAVSLRRRVSPRPADGRPDAPALRSDPDPIRVRARRPRRCLSAVHEWRLGPRPVHLGPDGRQRGIHRQRRPIRHQAQPVARRLAAG